MLERTKTPPTESVELRFIVPIAKADKVRRAVAPYISEETSAVPWSEAFPDNTPGRCIRGGRVKEGLTQVELAKRMGIPQRHISEMENNKRPIGKEMAKRLAVALGVGYKVFL